MANISMQELSELSNNELLDIKRFIEVEMKVRSDLEMNEKAHKLANIIQQIVDLGYIVRERMYGDIEHPQYTLENKNGIDRYRITPDYAYHNEDDMVNYGYSLEKWNVKKNIWEDITNG